MKLIFASQILLAVTVLLLTPRIARAESDACKKALAIELPKADQPSATDKKALRDTCAAAWSYYGLDGAKPDFIKARKCGYLERDAEINGKLKDVDHLPLGTLAMIYANGKGVVRNLDLARRFACEAPGFASEKDARLKILMENSGDFDFCLNNNAADPGCASLASKRAEKATTDSLAAMGDKLDPEARAKFSAVMAAADEYFEAEAERIAQAKEPNEDSRGAIATETRNRMWADLLDLLTVLEDKKKFSVTRLSLGEAESGLEKKLAALRAKTNDDDKETFDLARTSWTKYRDALASFGSARFEPKNFIMWKTELTRRRTQAL